GNGTVWTWGRNNNGQLGLGNRTNRTTPAQIPGIPAIRLIGCGRDHALAATTAGQLYGWGLDNFGQLGDRAGTPRNSPVAITGITGVESLHGGYGYSVIMRSA
ncbi:MAG: hypothetical protein ACRCYU_23650, partial [Nocardioides sp.]